MAQTFMIMFSQHTEACVYKVQSHKIYLHSTLYYVQLNLHNKD